MRYAPYPFSRLPKLTRAQARALSQFPSLAAGITLHAARETARSLLGVPVEVSAGIAEPAEFEAAADELQHVVWAELERAQTYDRLWLAIPLGLAELLADRVLGGEGDASATGSGRALDDLSLGALMYFGARVCAALGAGLRLCGIGPRTPPRAAHLSALLRCPVSVCVGAAHASAWVYARPDPSGAVRSAQQGAGRQRLRELPLEAWADGGSARVDLGTLRSLEPGDVVVLDRSGLVHSAGLWSGSVVLRVAGSGTRIGCRAAARRLEVESIACTPEPAMSTGRSVTAPEGPAAADPTAPGPEREAAREPLSALASDAPIELGLELARFQLTLGELEQLAPGQVLVTGRRIGEAVTLRAAGQAIAEGELVDVDGEVGVRITRLP